MYRTALIDYFRKGIVAEDKSAKLDFALVNKKAVLVGYLISPECCNVYVSEWLDTLTRNFNATFYKEWASVISKNRFEIFIDQLRHYASTYGKALNGEPIEGNGYVPNDNPEFGVPAFRDLKVIEPITEAELCEKCLEVLKSGIALKADTMKVLCDCVKEVKYNGKKVSKTEIQNLLVQIKNREAVCYMSKLFSVLPADEFGLLRCIVSAYTGKTELIQDKRTIKQIKDLKIAEKENPLMLLSEKQMGRLSRIFKRYKKLFLAMKREGAVSHVINRIRRMAEKNHTPLKVGFWENIITTQHPIKKVKAELKNLDNFRKVRLMMICKERMTFPTTSGVFNIRNGKQYVRTDYNPTYNNTWLANLYYAIEESLVETLQAKACTVRIPEYWNLVLPTSEKSFIGNYPYGTNIRMDKNNVIGIYWRNEWGTRDFDLSLTDIYGNHVGWNSNYTAHDCQVLYSGDMTNANPEAVEMMYCKEGIPNSIIRVNRFFGKEDSKFRLFYASGCSKEVLNCRTHMVDPNYVKFDAMIPHGPQRQKCVGMVVDNFFYLMDMDTGNNRVSSASRLKYGSVVMEALQKKAKCFIPLKDILMKAGFTLLDSEFEVDADMDFTNPTKDMLIRLLANG
jgi:hypothetical protein